jgi:hypothetical protein
LEVDQAAKRRCHCDGAILSEVGHSLPKWVARATSAIPPIATAACDAKSTSCRSTRRLIRHEIIVAAQRVLDSERGTRRRISIGSASGYHAQRPVTLGMAVNDAIYYEARNTRTAGLSSNFFQRQRLQSLHRK